MTGASAGWNGPFGCIAASTPQFGEVIAGADYILRPGGYLVVGNAQGEIAVVATPRGLFLPGGGQEDGETPEEAAAREALEECGLRVEIRACLGVADELVRAASDARYFRKRCTFFRSEMVACDGGGEADHQLFWLPADVAVATLSHRSQAWAVAKI